MLRQRADSGVGFPAPALAPEAVGDARADAVLRASEERFRVAEERFRALVGTARGTTVQTMTFRSYNVPVTIAAPPPAQVVEAG